MIKLPPRNLEELHWSMVYSKIMEHHEDIFSGVAAIENIKTELKALHIAKRNFLERAELDTIAVYIQSFQSIEKAWNTVDPKKEGTVETIKEEYLGLIQAEKENIKAMKNTIERRLALVDA